MQGNVMEGLRKSITPQQWWAFVESNYFDIAKEVYRKTQQYNVSKKELVGD
jgi:hypothetical protein